MPGPKVSDEEILRAIAIHPDPVVTVTEMVEQFDLTQQAIHSRLTRFESKGWVESKKAGARARVWWITTDGRDYLASDS